MEHEYHGHQRYHGYHELSSKGWQSQEAGSRQHFASLRGARQRDSIDASQKHDGASSQHQLECDTKYGAGGGMSETEINKQTIHKISRAFFDCGKTGFT